MRKLSYQFNLCSGDYDHQDLHVLVNDVMPALDDEVRAQFRAGLSPDMAALYENLSNDMIDAVPTDQSTADFIQKAGRLVLENYEPYQYALLDEQEQKFLVSIFLREEPEIRAQDPALADSIKTNLVRALDIPSELVELHQNKMAELRELILTDGNVAGICHNIAFAGHFDVPAEQKQAFGPQYVELLAGLYGVQNPDLDYVDFDKEGLQGRAQVHVNPQDKTVHTMIQAKNWSTDRDETYNSDEYVMAFGTLSHEFGHLVEHTLVLSAEPLNEQLSISEGDRQYYPTMDSDQPLASARLMIALNSSILGGNNYLESSCQDESLNEVYREQLVERHAEYFREMCQETIYSALKERNDMIAEHDKICRVVGTQLGYLVGRLQGNPVLDTLFPKEKEMPRNDSFLVS